MTYTQFELLERIKALCSSKGVTIQKLEQESGLSNGTIRRWEQFFPRVDRLAAVADFFNVSIDWLLGREPFRVSPSALEIAKSYDLADERSKKLAQILLIDEIRAGTLEGMQKKDGA